MTDETIRDFARRLTAALAKANADELAVLASFITADEGWNFDLDTVEDLIAERTDPDYWGNDGGTDTLTPEDRERIQNWKGDGFFN